MMHYRYKLIMLLLLVAALGPGADAQQTSGALQGLVADTAGRGLAGATITAIHIPSGTRYSTATAADGRYILPALRIGGPYRIEVSFADMESQMREVDRISLGDPLNLNLTLVPAGRQLSAVVVTAARAARANAYGAGQNITREQIRDMPMINRSLQDLTRSVPQGSKDNTFAGSSYRYNNVTIDGAINNDAIGFSPSIGGVAGTSGQPGSSTRTNPISLDAIEDIQVYIAPYDVKIGNFTGGSINAVTRSGNNTLAGSIYSFGSIPILIGPNNAADGSSIPGVFYNYQGGFRLGGPIVKNKLFFFSNEEVTRRQDPIQQVAGSPDEAAVLTMQDAANIRSHTLAEFGFDPGTYGQFNVYSRSNKFFNRLDWNLDPNNQLTLRNNTIFSQALNLERDQQDFRFGSIAYQQVNNQTSTVGELKTRLSNQWNNSLTAGFAAVHDYRNPLSDPAFPQVQIVGETPGSTIFFGTDREGSVFNQRQRTVEFTDNLTWNQGKHTVTFGTHNEFYHINYGFVNSWNGRVDYPSIQDFLNDNPTRVRGSYNYLNDTRAYILAHPVAVFNIDFLSAYVQDEIKVTDRFKLTPGLRFDFVELPRKPILSSKTQNALPDPDIGTTYSYTKLRDINNDYLNRLKVSPRIGFSYDFTGDRRLMVRGGLGMFTGRIPLAWLGYSFYNNGNSYGAFDKKAGNGQGVFTGSPLQYDKKIGIGAFAQQNGAIIDNVSGGQTQVDVFDNYFSMPKILRTSVAFEYTDPLQFHYSLEGIFTKTIRDVKFQQVNLLDAPTYYVYDTASRKQPIFASGSADPTFANAYEITNTSQGYRYNVTAKITRSWRSGLDASAAYTYGAAKDISNGIRNSLESNWQLNQALNPNNPQLAWSNFDIRHRIVATLGYHFSWHNAWRTSFFVYFSGQSGSPFTYGFVNYTVQNTPQQVSLSYIPRVGETINFFADVTDQTGKVIQSAVSQAAAFDSYIDHNTYLNSRRGNFTERNSGRTPWNNQADFHFQQDFGIGGLRIFSLTADIVNLTNLLYKGWGWVYFSSNTYNSTESIGLNPYFPARSSAGYPLYTWQNPGKPYSIDEFNSRYQVQLGLRYTF